MSDTPHDDKPTGLEEQFRELMQRANFAFVGPREEKREQEAPADRFLISENQKPKYSIKKKRISKLILKM